MPDPRLDLPDTELDAFCRRWNIAELALFGSVLRPDFAPDSDIDILVTSGTDARWSLLDLARMEDELSTLIGRRVDLVSRHGVEQSANSIIRRHILSTAQVLYATR